MKLSRHDVFASLDIWGIEHDRVFTFAGDMNRIQARSKQANNVVSLETIEPCISGSVSSFILLSKVYIYIYL